ncbi:hypothetical protein B7P43_G18233 [Cryptotermes secundus]|uniref:Guanine nucleotide-binding protein-like 1 n=1 Tax=Cryptotermes secundus TaxID=105785 RepID=A0A2J7QDW4_9NEOP|nr:hypothetical protein B7P43_G18233 [Cryptotermes secundus]
MRNAYRISVGNPEEKIPLGRARCRWVNNIKRDLREIGWDGIDWIVRIDLTQDKDQWKALVNTEYISELEKKFTWKELSYFELNLETWRQLWRVLEMSDIVLIIVDIRYCALMFPPSVYNYVTEMLHKDMILVLNKIDLAPAPLVVAWKHYFQQKYPAIHILTFTSFPAYNLRGNQENKADMQLNVSQSLWKLWVIVLYHTELLQDFASCYLLLFVVDLSSWHKKISEEMELEFDDEDIEVGETVEMKKVDTGYFEHEKYKDGTLTIGCIGQPNVGKSSLMNAIMGKKVVSVSRTPGHTKHFQTIYLTPNVRLCDCPGLVFPSKVPKTLQVQLYAFKNYFKKFW